jgi:LCP family protein required for cell wall assembly
MNVSDRVVIDKKPPQGSGKAFRALLVIFVILVLALIVLVGYYILKFTEIGKKGFDQGEITDELIADEEASGLPSAANQNGNASEIGKAEGEIDILMIGVDNRDNKFTGRSDVMMYLRVNLEEKTIKLVSFMRDTLVKIEGREKKNRLNTAYYFGGLDLIYSTYAQQFGLTPDYYIVVNFYGMEDIVDALGGVDVEIRSDEIEWLNININEINGEDPGGKVANINSAGVHHLSGRQAVAYMRIRHPGGDAGRIARQQTVMFKLFEKAQNISIGQIPTLIDTLSSYVKTDFASNAANLQTLLNLAQSIRGMSRDDLSTFRYPDSYKNVNYNGASVIQPKDFDEEFQKLYDFLND